MNIYHRIISSVYLRVPRHLFWYAAIFFAATPDAWGYARTLMLLLPLPPTLGPLAAYSFLDLPHVRRTSMPGRRLARRCCCSSSSRSSTWSSSASRHPHVRLSDRCHLDLLNDGYQYQVARSLAHARVRRPARRCCYSSSSRPFGMVLVGIAASSRSTR